MKFNTGNKDLNNWLKFYHSENLSNTKFIKLLEKSDKSFLTSSPHIDIEDELNEFLPENGVLTIDLKKIAFDTNNLHTESKNRIVLSILNHVNFEKWKITYSNILQDVVEKSLIQGDYEIFGVNLEQVIPIAIDKGLLDKYDLMGTAILRGIVLGDRYPKKFQEVELNKKIKINKFKLKIGI